MALDSSDALAVTAIVISLIALASTIGQILQQYIGTSEGFRRCRASIMGQWGRHTHRKFDWGDMRFEVFFDTPVIFVDYLHTFVGPIPGHAVHRIDGTDESCRSTDTPAIAKSLPNWYGETASWIVLLEKLQRNERESRRWDIKGPRPAGSPTYQPPVYPLCVSLQKKTQSWSFVPAGTVKPYASTWMSNFIEIVAMLGMHWVAFDQTIGNMIADGNGMIVTSSLVQGLGLLVTFAVVGTSNSPYERVIPTLELRSLCFGLIPNLVDGERRGRPNINFASRDETSSTLEFLGCRDSTIQKHRKNPIYHLFPVEFEIIGMLGLCVRIRGSNFRRLPNPTVHHWPEKVNFVSLLKLFAKESDRYYGIASQDIGADRKHELQYLQLILQLFETLPAAMADLNIIHREKVHDILDACTEYLQRLPVEAQKEVVASHVDESVNRPRDHDRATPRRSREETWVDCYLGGIRSAIGKVKDTNGESSSTLDGEAKKFIWTMLVARMLCWFLLHDFHPMDVNIIPSNLKGSRIPVYIG